MKKIVTILLFALTVFAGCSKDEKPTPAPTMPVNGVIYLHSESVLKNEPAAKAATRGATAARHPRDRQNPDFLGDMETGFLDSLAHGHQINDRIGLQQRGFGGETDGGL